MPGSGTPNLSGDVNDEGHCHRGTAALDLQTAEHGVPTREGAVGVRAHGPGHCVGRQTPAQQFPELAV